MNLRTVSLALLMFLPQESYAPADFVRVNAASFQAAYDDAIDQGRRGNTATFWIAYEMPARATVRVNTSDGIDVVQRGNTERLALFFLVRKSDGAVDKLRVVNFSQDVRVHDRKVYWLGEPKGDDSAALLLKLARSSSSTQVKKDAVFWLGQEISRRAGEELEKLATSDPDVEVQKQVVFALSQRAADESIPALERIAREHSNAAVRQQAIFWLGQKRDPRVLDFFEQMLKK